MNTKKNAFHFVILIPHRDAETPFNEYRQKLFSIGAFGAYSFPAAAPLAAVSSPFSRDELKELAGTLRRLSAKTDGKILCQRTNVTVNFEHLSFFGPPVDLPLDKGCFPETARNKGLFVLCSPPLCAALLSPEEPQPHEPPPALSFRAAALANLAIWPLADGEKGYSYEWETGPLVWLPKKI